MNIQNDIDADAIRERYNGPDRDQLLIELLIELKRTSSGLVCFLDELLKPAPERL